LEEFGLPVFSLLIIATLSRDETRIIKVLKCCFCCVYLWIDVWSCLHLPLVQIYLDRGLLLIDLASFHWDVASPHRSGLPSLGRGLYFTDLAFIHWAVPSDCVFKTVVPLLAQGFYLLEGYVGTRVWSQNFSVWCFKCLLLLVARKSLHL
jgi:hypothetical protein